jgi:hypothetical protein
MSDQDTRDEHLGELLDRAVRDLGAQPRLDPIIRGGARRRGARLVASVAVVVVFVAGVVWAATQIGARHTTAPLHSTTPTPTVYRDDQDGLSVVVPPGWQVAVEPLNTWVSDPHEILSMGTYALRPGGQAVTDFQLPSHAIDDLGPNDLLIWLNESGSGPRGFPPRPDRFAPSRSCDNWTELCAEPTGTAVRAGDERAPDIRGWWLGFHDAGRGFYVFVGMGAQAYADPMRAKTPWEILDSLSFDPAPTGDVFAACPGITDAVPPGEDAVATAEAAATAFVRAFLSGDDATVAAYSDPVASENQIDITAAATTDPILGSASAADDPAASACGPEVAGLSWAVTIDDGTNSASMDFVLYLIRRADGWEVWGMY